MALLAQYKVKTTLVAIASLLLFFSLYLVYAIIKDGDSGNCGCFGTYLQMTPSESIIKNCILLFITFLLYWMYDEGKKIFYIQIILLALTASILPLLFYFSWIDFLANTLNFIIFESLVFFLLIIIILNNKFKNRIIKLVTIITICITSFSIPFAINPPDFFVIDTYGSDKVNYELKADKLDEFAKSGIDNNWREGNKVIAFLSLTCPHCRDMAFKLHIIKNQHPDMKILFVYGGDKKDKKLFLTRAKCHDMPSITLTMDEMVKITGPFFPTVVGINNGIVKNKWNVINMTEKEMLNFFK